MERTLAIIKPGVGIDNLSAISHIIMVRKERGDFKAVRERLIRFDAPLAEQFYEAHRGKHFFEWLIKHMVSGECMAIVLEGENVIARWRALMKPIREIFAKDGPDNAVHGSDSAEAAESEIALLFPALQSAGQESPAP